jgi:sodium/proline symporter
LFDLSEIAPGVLLATVAIVACSLLTEAPSKVLREDFSRFQQALAE